MIQVRVKGDGNLAALVRLKVALEKYLQGKGHEIDSKYKSNGPESALTYKIRETIWYLKKHRQRSAVKALEPYHERLCDLEDDLPQFGVIAQLLLQGFNRKDASDVSGD